MNFDPQKCHCLVEGRQCKMNKKYPIDNPMFCHHHKDDQCKSVINQKVNVSQAKPSPLPPKQHMEPLPSKQHIEPSPVPYNQTHEQSPLPRSKIEEIRKIQTRESRSFPTETRGTREIRHEESNEPEDTIPELNFLTRHQEQPSFDVSKITTKTTPEKLFQIINSNPKYQITDDVKQGQTLIHYLVSHGYLALIQALLTKHQWGTKILTIANIHGETPLSMAITDTEIPMAIALIDLGAPLDLKTPVIHTKKISDLDLSDVPWKTPIEQILELANEEERYTRSVGEEPRLYPPLVRKLAERS